MYYFIVNPNARNGQGKEQMEKVGEAAGAYRCDI